MVQIENVSDQTGRTRNELIGIMLEYALRNYRISDNEEGKKTI